ncbi:protein Tob1-like [Amblyomma americanum]
MHSVADSEAGPSRMQVEIQVALNFLVSFLYNKLPRRRVNQFAEELDRALRRKFRGHWYPEKPYRGSAFRCVKTSPPLDPVFQIAARESGVDLRDVRENLPPDLSIWIDPGEVSYRIGEKGAAQVLLGGPPSSASESRCCSTSPGSPDDALVAQLVGLGLGPGAAMTPLSPGPGTQPAAAATPVLAAAAAAAAAAGHHGSPCGSGVTPPTPVVNGATRSLTFTTASFAQTKFGSTKLKTSSKRAQRLSPTELGLRREQQQQQHQQQQQQQQQHQPQPPHTRAAPQSNGAGAPGNPLSPHVDLYGTALPVDGFGDAAAAAVVASQVAAAAAASCPPPTSRFAASPFLAAAGGSGSLQGHHHGHHHHHHHPAVSGAAAELGAALQQHLLLAN